MQQKNLANKLINAVNATERKNLLNQNKDLADLRLAWKLKEICYESWTNEPTIAQKTASALKTLAKIDSNKEIEALLFWVSGIAELTKGNLDKTIENLDRSATIFKSIGKNNEASQTQVAKLIPLALLGKYEEAIKTGEKSLKTFEKIGDVLAAGKVEMNLSNIVSRRGQHLKALKYCESALKKFIQTNEKEWQTMAENGLANTYSELNDFHNAKEFYEKALQTAKSAEMFVTEAEIEASLGNLATFRGNYSDALNFLEMSRRKFQELKMPHQTAIADLEIAEIYQTLNLTKESYEIYEKVSESFRKLKLQGEEARTRKNFGKVAVKTGEYEKARMELQKSAKLYLAENNSTGAASVKLSEANLEITLGNYLKALEIILESKKLLKKSENFRLRLQADFLHGDVLRSLKKYIVSEKFLEKTYTEALKNEQKALAQNCLNSLGKLALQKGAISAAETYFKKSIEIIENLRSPLPAEEFRMAFLANNLVPFQSLAKIYIKQNQFEKAFVSIEKARSRSLAEAIQAIGEKSSADEIGNVKLNETLNILREELNWFYSRLSRAKDSEIEDLQHTLRKKEKQIDEIKRQISSTKESAFTENNDEISIKELQRNVGENQVLIEFVKFEDNFSAFVITDKEIKYVRDLTDESEINSLLEGLQFQFGALRYGDKFAEKFGDILKQKADIYLQKLYGKLLAPLEDFIEGRNLVIIPVSTLFYVPFCGLFNGEKYLIENHEVITSPSATVWKNLVKKNTNKKLSKTLLIGFADENIPLVNKEIKELKQILPNATSFSGNKATFKNYTENASHKDILHIACHGQFRPDNPLFSSLHLADGFVTVRDICSQNLNAELVTLSACETGLNKIHAGDEILGLARGFLTAGVQTLVLSLWTVNDAATGKLMKDFYTEIQRGKSISASLQKAQINIIERGKHPYFWSSFGIIGK